MYLDGEDLPGDKTDLTEEQPVDTPGEVPIVEAEDDVELDEDEDNEADEDEEVV